MQQNPLPSNEMELDELLSRPYPEDIEAARNLGGDVLVLGAAGKMGPTFVQRVCRAVRAAGVSSRVFAVSRFSDEGLAELLTQSGAEVIRADLLSPGALDSLPDCPNVFCFLGSKFGTSRNESVTWGTNTFLPGQIALRWRDSRIVAWSTGNVYPLVSIKSGGSKETDVLGPVGEYAQSCLGRERIYQYFSSRYSTSICLLRLNYAVELRYGVLLDIAMKVYSGVPVPLEMGHLNAIWQGDANSICLRSLRFCNSPPAILNVTGLQTLSVQEIALKFGRLFGTKVLFSGRARNTALLSNPTRCAELMGPPGMDLSHVMRMVVHWVQAGGPLLGKPTKFEVRNGRF